MIALGADVTIKGSDGGDFLWSASGANTLQGGKGDDVIHSKGSNDTVIGSGGNDAIYGNASGSTTLRYNDPAVATNVILSSDNQGNSSLTIDKGSAGTDTATGIKTLVLSSSQPNTVAIAGKPTLAGGLTIDGASSAQSGPRETIDFTLFSQALNIYDGNVPDIGVTFKNFNFGALIGTANGDAFNVLDQASASASKPGFERIDGGGGNDTFNADYGSGGGAPLLLMGGSGDDTFHFKNAANQSLTFVYGGDGKDTFNFDQGAPNNLNTTVIEMDIQGLTADKLRNLDLNKVEGAISDQLTAANIWAGDVNKAIVIINPDSQDKIEINGQMVESPKYTQTNHVVEKDGMTVISDYYVYGFMAKQYSYQFLTENDSTFSSEVLITPDSRTPGQGLYLAGFQNVDFGVSPQGDGPGATARGRQASF